MALVASCLTKAPATKTQSSLNPGEPVEVLALYGPWDGVYMFHWHNLIHEDHVMMAAFNVTLLEALGYDLNSTVKFDDPMGTQFSAQNYSDEAFASAAVSSAVVSLASLYPYGAASSLMAVESTYYATAPFADEGAVTDAPRAASATAGRTI